MSSRVYHEIFLHLNWHTKENRALLRDEVEKLTHRVLEEQCRKVKGAYLHGVGGTDDHVHLAISIEPSILISDLVQQLKGGSSHEVNKLLERKILEWQCGYGVVSFGRANLGWVLDYIKRQREHHSTGRLFLRLESFEESPNADLTEKPG